MQETWEMWVQSLDCEDSLEEGMATHSSILAWRIPWTEETGRLQSMGSQKSQTWLKQLSMHTHSQLGIWYHLVMKIYLWICIFDKKQPSEPKEWCIPIWSSGTSLVITVSVYEQHKEWSFIIFKFPRKTIREIHQRETQYKTYKSPDHFAETLLMDNQRRKVILKMARKWYLIPSPSIFMCMSIIVISELVHYSSLTLKWSSLILSEVGCCSENEDGCTWL